MKVKELLETFQGLNTIIIGSCNKHIEKGEDCKVVMNIIRYEEFTKEDFEWNDKTVNTIMIEQRSSLGKCISIFVDKD